MNLIVVNAANRLAARSALVAAGVPAASVRGMTLRQLEYSVAEHLPPETAQQLTVMALGGLPFVGITCADGSTISGSHPTVESATDYALGAVRRNPGAWGFVWNADAAVAAVITEG